MGAITMIELLVPLVVVGVVLYHQQLRADGRAIKTIINGWSCCSRVSAAARGRHRERPHVVRPVLSDAHLVVGQDWLEWRYFPVTGRGQPCRRPFAHGVDLADTIHSVCGCAHPPLTGWRNVFSRGSTHPIHGNSEGRVQ
jgi:hypothetical protein